jgi:hypothetical protein
MYKSFTDIRNFESLVMSSILIPLFTELLSKSVQFNHGKCNNIRLSRNLKYSQLPYLTDMPVKSSQNRKFSGRGWKTMNFLNTNRRETGVNFYIINKDVNMHVQRYNVARSPWKCKNSFALWCWRKHITVNCVINIESVGMEAQSCLLNIFVLHISLLTAWNTLMPSCTVLHIFGLF